MKRMKLVCPRSPRHKTFRANVAVVMTGVFDENGDFLKTMRGILGLTEMLNQEGTKNLVSLPGPDSEWLCNVCEEEPIVEMTGLDPEDLEKRKTKATKQNRSHAKRTIGAGKKVS